MHIPQHNQTEPCVLIDWSTSNCTRQRVNRLTRYERHTLNRALRLNGTTLRWIPDEQVTSSQNSDETCGENTQSQGEQAFTTSIRHLEAILETNRKR